MANPNNANCSESCNSNNKINDVTSTLDNTPANSTSSSVIHKSTHKHTPPSPIHTMKKKARHQYGDRYIPNRNGINFQAAYSLVQPESEHQKPSPPVVTELSHRKMQEANNTFSSLLKAEIFGGQVPFALPDPASIKRTGLDNSINSSNGLSNSYSINRDPQTPKRPTRSAPTTPNKNMFRYQSPNKPKYYLSSSVNMLDLPTTPTSIDQQTDHQIELAARSCRYSSGRVPYDELNKFQTTPPPSRLKSPRLIRDAIDPNNEIYSLSPVRLESQRLLLSAKKEERGFPSIPYKILDAPELIDDFYLNLIDWGSQDMLAVALGKCVYLWNSQNSMVTKMCDMGTEDSVTSISWIKRGSHVAIGTRKGLVQIWDAERTKRIRTMTGHDMRTGALAWNEHILSSGSRDRSILHRDVRIPDHYIKRVTGHRQEVCGLKWNTDENQLASGGNDNKLLVWDGMESKPLYRFSDHNAAVKAIAWSPHSRGLLATGGGTADRRIRFWNTLTGTCINEIDTGSQVCNLAWSKNTNDLISTHGYSKNHVAVWKYPSMQQIAVLTGHTYRVLYLAMSPDGNTIVTGAGDETLRFWKLYGNQKSESRTNTSLLDVFPQLR